MYKKKCVVCGEGFRKSTNISFHRFPINEDLRALWLDACQLDELDINPYSVVCSKHFSSNDFEVFNKHRTLKQGAIPQTATTSSVSSNRSSVQVITQLEGTQQIDEQVKDIMLHGCTSDKQIEHSYAKNPDGLSLCSKCAAPISKLMVMESTQTEYFDVSAERPVRTPSPTTEMTIQGSMEYRTPRYIGDLKFQHFSTPKRTQRHLSLVKKLFSQQQRKLKIMRETKRKLSRHIITLSDLLTELEKKKIITNENSEMLLTMTPDTIKEILDRKMKYGRKFSVALRSFAITLHFYSPRAYNFVRQNFQKLLPHPNTIRKWYQVIGGEPGYTREAFEAISVKVSYLKELNKDKLDNEKKSPVVVNIAMDEMSIRQQVVWDDKKNKWFGFVDLGTGLTSDSDMMPQAKSALVVMAVALNDHWKVPLGYFLIQSLSGKERANLLITCLQLLYETGAFTFSITFDGAPVNLTMCTELGANFKLSEKFNPSFPHSVSHEEVLIFFDACHIIKLIRNMIGERKVIFNGKDEPIKWEYLEKLLKLQERAGLMAANKLTTRHLNFYNEKMNVRLAVQTLSASVSHALHSMLKTLHDLLQLKFLEYQDKFDQLDQMTVDENSPPEKLKNSNFVGYHGDFKTLEIN